MIGKDGREVGRKNCRRRSTAFGTVRGELGLLRFNSTGGDIRVRSGGGSVVLWICPLTRCARSSFASLSFVPSFCDRSHSGAKEGEQSGGGGGVSSFERSVDLAPARPPARPLSMSRRRPSSCVTAVASASAVAATFSKSTVDVPHLPSSFSSPSASSVDWR